MKMTVREVIRRLEETAENLPLGQDSPVIVMLCDGTDAEGSRELEIDTLVWFRGGQPRDAAAMIKGHPHIDQDEGHRTHLRGVVRDADEILREWAGSGEDGPGPAGT